MTSAHRPIPSSLHRVLEAFRPCFTAPTHATFTTLVAGLVSCPAARSVCGMWSGAGLAGTAHHTRAHRFFAAARWDPANLGLVLLRLIAGHLIPIGAPVVVAVDDTMFRRRGQKVDGAHWAYDGSLKVLDNRHKVSRGNTFVIAAIVVNLPFLDRPIALPVLATLWRKDGPTKVEIALSMIDTIARALPTRDVHLVADSRYICGPMRHLPPTATLTGPVPKNIVLREVHPDVDRAPTLRRRGRPKVRGERIGTPADLVKTTKGRKLTVTRYGRTTTVTVYERRCLWYGALRGQPVRIIVVEEPRQHSVTLLTTDPTATTEQIITRYASRWSIEVAIRDAKENTGAGQARNRIPKAVERTVPFTLITQSIVILWYHLAGHSPAVIADRRRNAPWYRTKTQPSYRDMLVKLRRVLIAAQYRAASDRAPTHEELQGTRLAWSDAAA